MSWPSLDYSEWLDTYETLHRYTQVVGKVKLALSPFLNEWWHTALNPWARGLTTGIIPYDKGLLEIRFDLLSHKEELLFSDGTTYSRELAAMNIAENYAWVTSSLTEMGIVVHLNPTPQEMEDTLSLDTDTLHHIYNPSDAERFWRVISLVAIPFEKFRSGFFGKASPLHFWWGSFDLNLTRFAGRMCEPPPKSGRLARVDCDEEHFSAGFWPGDKRFPQPGFYAYSYPASKGVEKQIIRPAEAHWNPVMGEFILPYEVVRVSPDPERAILDFLNGTYEAAANLGNWNRAFLERKVK